MRAGKEDFAVVSLLKDCVKNKDLRKGIRIHADLVKNGLLGKSPHLASTLINMYAKCGMLGKAQEVLENLQFRDVVTWNTLISGYIKHGQGHEALQCYEMMRNEGFSPVNVTYICVLKACGKTCNVDKGIQIHKEIAAKGLLKSDVMLGNALVDMYIKLSMVKKAQKVQEELPVRDVVSWNALIAGYAQQGQGHEALNCYEKMQKEGFSPDSITFNCLLKACGNIGSVEKGEQVHEKIARMGLLKKNLVLANALVDMYAKCGMLTKAQKLLDELSDRNAISWNALVAGYINKGLGIQALNCFERMQSEGFPGDVITFICILKACGSTGDIDKGKQIHNEILSRGLLEKDIVLGTALVDMYGKCGVLKKAQQVLEDLPIRDIVSWNALITGYVQQEKGHDALDCFDQMLSEGLCPDVVTFICILKVCGSIGAIGKGKQIHEEVVSKGLLLNDLVLSTALIDMYVKCGVLGKAREVLEELPARNVVSWNALISGYTQQGYGYEALRCLEKMQEDGLSPDDATLQCVLCACGHSGLMDEAQVLFNDMANKYGIAPTLEHQTCMVEGFGFAGDFDKAASMMKVMPSCDDISLWLGMLGACRKWGNVNLGRLCFDQIVQLDGNCASAYVLMANMFASSGMQEDAERVEAMRTQYAPSAGGKKMSGVGSTFCHLSTKSG